MKIDDGKIVVISQPTHVTISWYVGSGFVERATVSADLVDQWWINRVLVQPESNRGLGIGSHLLKMLKEEVKKQGGTKIVVAPGGYDQNKDRQVRFYKKHNFIEYEQGSYICFL